GYTGKVSQDELEELQNAENGKNYDLNDTVGKLGIEKSMESELQGTKGSETIFVDNVGKVTDTIDYVEPVAGNDVYLTIDKDLQIAVYKILEERLAGILCTNIINARDFDTSEVSSSKIKIPIYDVYVALINNNVIDTEHFSMRDAKETEKQVYETYRTKKADVFTRLREELTETLTAYNKLDMEYEVYESHIAEMLYNGGIIMREKVDTKDSTYIAWTTEEVISLNEYLKYCIAMNWIDVSKIKLEGQYSDSEQIYAKIVDYIFEQLEDDDSFTKKVYRFMIKNDLISGNQICQVLLEQGIVELTAEEEDLFNRGAIPAYNFMVDRIRNLDITPAQLALDPYSASAVITDVNTGDVLAMVSYPSYDNNKMANGVDAEYFSELLN
ncbi:MAG: penicillin-binding protein, partial [Lachnospiraceae bacterium]|nr:penicillin-binding protein [Lachnospiraceae bacterium]